MISNKQKKVPMKIYIVERDNPSYKPEPEVFTDGNKALHIVQEEYTNQMEVLGTSQEKSDAGYGSCGCYWNFKDGEYCGDALIDQDCDGERWEWRITEHIIESWYGGLEMYAYIGGISDTDEINHCPFCGEEISTIHMDGTVTCDSCERRFGVVETDPEE